MEITAAFEAAFWAHVVLRKADQCWPWNGTLTRRGYGVISRGTGTQIRAHRVSYVLEHGPIPDGLLVRHTCDNPRCVNPKHLLVGTNYDNAQDAVGRGRMAAGERSGRAKLTAAQACQIRDGGESPSWVAKKFGINESAVRKIRTGERWRCLSNATT
jgi:hypothetical protein